MIVWGKNHMEIVLQRDQTPSSQSKMQETPDYLQIGAEVSKTLDGSIAQKCCS